MRVKGKAVKKETCRAALKHNFARINNRTRGFSEKVLLLLRKQQENEEEQQEINIKHPSLAIRPLSLGNGM